MYTLLQAQALVPADRSLPLVDGQAERISGSARLVPDRMSRGSA